MMGTEAILNDGWGVFFLGVGAKGAFVLTLSAIAAMTLRRSSAALRHWLLGLVGVLALPFAVLVGPRWAIDVPSMPLSRLVEQVGLDATPTPPESGTATAQAAFPDEEGATRGTATDAGLERFSVEGQGSVVKGEGRVVSGLGGAQATPQAGSARAVLAAVDPETSLSASPIKGGTFLRLADVLFAIWAAGVVLLLSRLAASHRALRRLEREATVMRTGRVTTLSSRFARHMRIRRPVRILAGPKDAMPMSWGTRRPAVLLPQGAERWPTSRLEAVLLHELAHVRRRDCLTQLMAEVAVALHWVNPLAWVAAHRLRVEREHACDDQALGAGARASQ